MAERLAIGVEEVTQALLKATESGLVDLAAKTISEAAVALQEAKTDTRKVTVTGLFKVLKDPQAQLGLKTAYGLLKRLPNILE